MMLRYVFYGYFFFFVVIVVIFVLVVGDGIGRLMGL